MAHCDTTPILIAGATASGKSALALALAKRLNGVIINADSMQVYDTLRQLTARPSLAEEQEAPHRLYGHVAIGAQYNVGIWQSEALAEIAAAQANEQVPIIIGGTGLYFAALTEGLSDIPDIPNNVRKSWRARMDAEGSAALHAELAQRDPALAARLAPGDKQRILRALEVEAATGTRLSEWQKIKSPAPLTAARKILLMPGRPWLYARCNARFDMMMQGAAVAEVEHLWAFNLPPGMPVMKALGVPEILSMMHGELTREQAIEAAQQATRRYAKRQMTWFRNRMRDWRMFTEQDYEKEFDKIFSFIAQKDLTAT